MKFSYEINMEDYIEFNLHHLKQSKMVQKSLTGQRIGVSIFFLILPFLISSIFNQPLISYLITFSVASILWFMYYPKYFYKSTKNKMIKHLSENNDQSLFGEHSLEIDENGIKEITQTSELDLKWDKIVEIKEAKNYFYFYFSSVQAIILPIGAIKDHKANVIKYFNKNNIQVS